MEIAVSIYAMSWIVVALLAVFPFRGPREPDKAFVVASSLPVLAVGGVVQTTIVGVSSEGILLVAAALNLSIVVGTGLDPLRAVVHWDHESADDESDVESDRKAEIIDVRPRKAWPVLLIFAVSSLVITLGFPDLFERSAETFVR